MTEFRVPFPPEYTVWVLNICSNEYTTMRDLNPCPAEPGYALPLQTV